MNSLLFTLIKLSVGNITVSDGLTHKPDDEEWKEALIAANKQTLVGVLLPALEEINKKYPVPYNIWMQWNYFSQKIIEKNHRIDQKIVELGQILEEEGFSYCVLKGQGVARYYPNPNLRTPGDIDVWLWPKTGTSSSLKDRRQQIVSYVKSKTSCKTAMYHHIDFPIFAKDRVEVEAHFTPSWMFAYKKNSELQAFFESNYKKQFQDNLGIGFNTPNWQFNCVYVLNHIFRHLFDEGIGLRQLMDYYYILTSHKASAEEKAILCKILKASGLDKFAQAVMYVMKEVLSISDEFLITEIDEKKGSHLLYEIMTSGNFGRYDTRKRKLSNQETKSIKAIKRLLHSLELFPLYPREAISEMPFRIWQYFWRMKNNYI